MTNNSTAEQARFELAPGAGIPMIGLGTWPLAGEAAADAVARGLTNGYRHVDTAEKYGNEDAVGEGIRRSGIDRSELWITSKLSVAGHSRTAVRTAYGQALERLGLEYLDLFLIHWPNPKLDRYVETCAGLQDLVDEGLLRTWGVSNFKPAHLDRVAAEGLKPAVNQVQVDPHHLQRGQLDHHAALGIATAAYSPLGRAGAFLDHPAVTGPAAAYGKTPAQVVLRWHLDSGRIAVPKSASDARQLENLDVFDFALTGGERAAIDALDTGTGPRLDADDYGH
ncbi:aldo/keto reductase [Arthrobacter sp. I2-34]|uniref:Aldo/keto reductase n=1 Tax=Arthrobacter hankyongi TaxID=2904801 RepID=A0ABS9LCQ5_9MICC|nr:aldo/keto reductase [Arthrobacter hankyongi]MCG2624440.1 aldo/keto reductase [Arthrobacter hankyongi]